MNVDQQPGSNFRGALFQTVGSGVSPGDVGRWRALPSSGTRSGGVTSGSIAAQRAALCIQSCGEGGTERGMRWTWNRLCRMVVVLLLIGAGSLLGSTTVTAASSCSVSSQGCLRFRLSENTSLYKEYGYSGVPRYPSKQNIRDDGLYANVYSIRNRTWSGRFNAHASLSCKSRVQDSSTWVSTTLNYANKVSRSNGLPSGCMDV